MNQRTRPSILLERDGVLLHPPTTNGPISWNEVSFLPLALEALRLFAENNIHVILISDQGCTRDSGNTKHQLDSLTRRMLLEIALSGGYVEKVYYCPHNAREHCRCRKPFPGLLLRAMSEARLNPARTWFISNRESDLEVAERAGCHGILLRRNNFFTGHTRTEDSREIASNLYEVAECLVRQNIPLLANVLQMESGFPKQFLLPAFPNARTREKDLA